MCEKLRYSYALLGRLQVDCEYYLGHGQHNPACLWAKDEKRQLEKMRELYNQLPEDNKPSWINMRMIADYEKSMILR